MSQIPWRGEALDLLLSCYLDGELDLATRTELESWLEDHPEGRSRLEALRLASTSISLLDRSLPVPDGWTLKAYQIGMPPSMPRAKRSLLLALGRKVSVGQVVGHGVKRWSLCRCWRQSLPRGFRPPFAF